MISDNAREKRDGIGSEGKWIKLRDHEKGWKVGKKKGRREKKKRKHGVWKGE